MKSHLLLKSAIFISFALGSFGSSIYSQTQNFSCGPTVPTHKNFDRALYEKNRAEEIELIKAGVTQKAEDDTTYVIPIVFHILHEYGSENISDAQILDQMDILNEDYKMLNADTTDVAAVFKPLIGNANMEFRLAQIDPYGNCTNGIDRIYTQETRFGDDGAKMNPWPRGKYLNVWVVKSMEGGTAGYAYYPSATTQGLGAFIDGIIIRHNYIGSIGTSSPYNSRALTHEIGHYLSLAHVWGSTNDPGVACGDDGIDDTPETKGWDHCPSSGLDVCNPGIEENIHNYMEYSYCSHMFTKDQIARMRAVLNLPTALRNNLWTASNLAETGVDQTNPPLCEPLADFAASKSRICKGQSVTLNDNSSLGAVDTWSWSIPGATPSTSSAQNPTVTFPNAGWHSVSLTVSNASGSSTLTIDRAVYVSEDYDRYQGLATENFESFTASNIGNTYTSERVGFENEELPSVIINGGTVNVGNWQLATDAGYSGNKSLLLDAFRANNQMVDEFATPSFDLTYVSSPKLTFKYSAATSSSTIEDITEELKIYMSTNCGQTWQYRGSISGLDLITAGFDGSYFIPSSSSQWASKEITLPTNASTTNVRFKFEHTSGEYANNLYIDDIAIEGTLGINNNTGNNSVVVYPNPSNSISDIVLQIESDRSEQVSVQLLGSLGQVISTINGVNLAQGQNQIKLSEIGFEDVATGIYFVKIQGANNVLSTERIVIQK